MDIRTDHFITADHATEVHHGCDGAIRQKPIDGSVDKLGELVSIHAALTGQYGCMVDVATAVNTKTTLDEGVASKPWKSHKALLVELRKAETRPNIAAAAYRC